MFMHIPEWTDLNELSIFNDKSVRVGRATDMAILSGAKLSEHIYMDITRLDKTDLDKLDDVVRDKLQRYQGTGLTDDEVNRYFDVLKKTVVFKRPDWISKSFSGCATRYLTKSFDGETGIKIVDYAGWCDYGRPQSKDYGMRVMAVATAQELQKMRIVPTNDKALVVEYGHFPQMVADNQNVLEEEFQSGKILPTDMKFTFNKNKSDVRLPFEPKDYPVYNFDGKYYIRDVLDDKNLFNGNCFISLSDGLKKYNDVVWIQVEPIQWLVDPSGKMITKKILVSGIELFALKFVRNKITDDIKRKEYNWKEQSVLGPLGKYLHFYFSVQSRQIQKLRLYTMREVFLDIVQKRRMQNTVAQMYAQKAAMDR